MEKPEYMKMHQQLITFLKPAGYIPVENSVGMWKHKTRKTLFCLCVEDFGIKHFNQDDLTHLLTTLREHYTVSVDKEGRNFCGLTLDWHYADDYVDVSMPGYIAKVLSKYNHKKPSKPEFAPHKHVEPVYGAKQQVTTVDNTPKIRQERNKTNPRYCRFPFVLFTSNRQYNVNCNK